MCLTIMFKYVLQTSREALYFILVFLYQYMHISVDASIVFPLKTSILDNRLVLGMLLNWHLLLDRFVVWICWELQHSISSVLIFYGTQSDIRVKSNCRLNLLRASVFNFECLDILRDSIRHPSKKLLYLTFHRVSVFNFERLDILKGSIGDPS